jgi:hypothetical protein
MWCMLLVCCVVVCCAVGGADDVRLMFCVSVPTMHVPVCERERLCVCECVCVCGVVRKQGR